MPIAGVDPEQEPSARPDRGTGRSRATTNGVTTIFTEELVSPRVAETLAREAGVTTAVLDPLEGRRRRAPGTTISTRMRRQPRRALQRPSIAPCSVASGACRRSQAHVEVTHLPGIADPAGATVERALPALGYTNVDAGAHRQDDPARRRRARRRRGARRRSNEMCERLLANPVIEAYEVTIS